MEKGVRNLRFLTTLMPRRHVTATCLILRQLASNNGRLPLFPTLIKLSFIKLIGYILVPKESIFSSAHI